MQCHRCGQNVPEFLWTNWTGGSDHPVLVDRLMNVSHTPLNDVDNKVKVTVEVYVEARMCSDVYPAYLPVETKNVNGVVCVIIHLSENSEHIRHPDGQLFITACTGQYFMWPGQNDTRPITLCTICLGKVKSL